ncbi:hypothetical protein BDV29DRAFT_198855 [Aspergillus leporis]|uniref:WD40-repeat-containing domain protein n=1 Tax=Aspergillus leporis TaxID=41062 RepID=A0A5N5WND2_9EURO|nr:hypothetical protein BDV29DRAFT_198855 [Aspergillus leporis]
MRYQPNSLQISRDIITGVYGSNPIIKVLDINGNTKWSLSIEDIQNQTHVPEWLKNCSRDGSAVTEMKWVEDGPKIAALIGGAAVVVNYNPKEPQEDKNVVFGVCTNTDMLNSCHTLEALPDNRLAIATTGQGERDGIWVYNASAGLHPSKSPLPIGITTCHPAIHAMIWDDREKILWAAGTDKAANNKCCPSYGLLNGYRYTSHRTTLEREPVYSYRMLTTTRCTTEWGPQTTNGGYWDGPHDIAPVPHERKFLITTELDVHEFDFESERFKAGDAVAETYMQGFVPLGRRVGMNRTGHLEKLPRSDLKSVSIAEDGNVVYNQANWADDFWSRQINVLVLNHHRPIPAPGRIYKARWLGSVPGWKPADWSL